MSKVTGTVSAERIIEDRQITAGSGAQSHEPFQCRLNNPISCWKPSKKLSKFNNSWIAVDLQQQTKVTKMRIQGNVGNTSYVKSIWIDYSNNGAKWECYNENREIECIPDEFAKTTLFANKRGMDKFAEIELWPPIIARYIRIRPVEHVNEIAMRFEFYGPLSNSREVSFARVIPYGKLSENEQREAQMRCPNAHKDTSIIQVDCRKVIRKALDDVGLSYVGYVHLQIVLLYHISMWIGHIQICGNRQK